MGVVCEFEGILVGTLFEPLPDGTPLYTAPKELSDEEIKQIYRNSFDNGVFDFYKFARALLKKASEK